MFYRKHHLLGSVIALVLAATPLFGNKMHEHSKMKEASVLLQKIESNAIGARHHASMLKSFTAQPVLHSWQVHVVELSHIKNQLNDIAELAGDFKKIKSGATKRQVKAFNALVPVATKASDHVDKAIRIVNEETEKVEVSHPKYENLVEGIYDGTDQIAAAIGFAESWSEVKEAQEELGIEPATE